MMKFDTAHDAVSEDLLDLTSMVDVAFILLTFFVLTARFLPQQRDAVLGASHRLSSAGASSQDLPASVTIRLLPGRAAGTPRILIGQSELPAGDFQAITASLKHMNVPDLPVVIAAADTLSVDAVGRALDAVMHSPMTRVSLAKVPGGQTDTGAGDGGGGGP